MVFVGDRRSDETLSKKDALLNGCVTIRLRQLVDGPSDFVGRLHLCRLENQTMLNELESDSAPLFASCIGIIGRIRFLLLS